MVGEHRAIGLERGLETAQLHQQQRKVEPRGGQVAPDLQGGAEGGLRLPGARVVREEHPEVVPRQGVRAVERDGALVRIPGGVAAAGLVQADSPLVPDLRGIGMFLDERVVELERAGQVPPQEVDLGHGLQREPAVLAVVEREPVLLQRLRVVAPSGGRRVRG